ncbi:hypothetical protein AU375_04459 [Methylobacterium radiotolerans]|nr:hypothetical protein AU375_04459 [Methylobacterium radiotolerans]
MQTFEILPSEIGNFSLPPGVRMPDNIVMTEDEAAKFLRMPVSRLQRHRLSGTGPAFVRHPDEGHGATYLLWDALSWLIRHRRTEMPPRARRLSGKAARVAADAADAA